jgi:sugar phosphate isomerase/epimerase
VIERRALLSGALALAACGPRREPAAFRHAACNETWEGASFEEACRDARAAGYEALEIAPATVEGRRPAELARAMRDQGLACVGLHALLAGTAFHATAPDAALRARTWEHLRRLADLCREIGGRFLVFGSGKQRSRTGGSTRRDATARFAEGLAGLAGRGVGILVEPLKPPFSDVVNTLDEAADVVRRVGHPDVAAMIDCRHSTGEPEAADVLVRRHAGILRHVHVNEADGRRPGTGRFDYGRLLAALREVGYPGWLSLEVFDFAEGGPAIARASIAHLRSFE